MSSKSSAAPVVVLFRRDLRIADNGALSAAADRGRPVIALFILDEQSPHIRVLGAASRWWLHRSLAALQSGLEGLGCPLVLRAGQTGSVVDEIVEASGADTVLWNRRYDPAEVAVDTALKSSLRQRGLTAESFDGALLHEPPRLKTGAGSYYKVFTPFWKALCAGPDPRDPIDAPQSLDGWSGSLKLGVLNDFGLLPTGPDWSGGIAAEWSPGEAGAHGRLGAFLGTALEKYADRRDLPGVEGTSRLSPHLAFGEITPFQIFAALRRHGGRPRSGLDTFRKELGWREFSYHLLFNNPDLHKRNFRGDFDDFDWRQDVPGRRKWQRGLTGYPIVDAGMRQLWQTGWMHNRVRMIAASFLIKHLGIDWREGETWFWDTLVDADPANNPASWQWVAGTGADAAPYFRIFNPILQGEKFDPKGDYVRRYVPELAGLPDRFIHRPWTAPASILRDSAVVLGHTYPKPIVDHGEARARALGAYGAARRGGTDNEGDKA